MFKRILKIFDTYLRDDMNADEKLLRSIISTLAISTTDKYRATRQLDLLGCFDPKPAAIPYPTEEIDEIKQDIISAFNGIPSLIFSLESAPPPEFDAYINAVIYEMERSLLIARRSLLRCHTWWVVYEWISEDPTRINVTEEKVSEQLCDEYQEILWEHLETAIIRMTSYWDRVGQLFDFVFFNIRSYDKEGFSSVIIKIRNNVKPQSQELSLGEEWSRLWKYHNTNSNEGLQWLLSRRNLLVHSLHFTAAIKNVAAVDDPLFTTANNQYENRKTEKLKQGTVKDEMETIHRQFDQACSLYQDILTIAAIGAKISSAKV